MDDWYKDKYKHVLERVFEEIEKAENRHSPMTSPIQAAMILMEEMEETWEAIRNDCPDLEEVAQVAATALIALRDHYHVSPDTVIKSIFTKNPFQNPVEWKTDRYRSYKEIYGMMKMSFDSFWLSLTGVKPAIQAGHHLIHLVQYSMIAMIPNNMEITPAKWKVHEDGHITARMGFSDFSETVRTGAIWSIVFFFALLVCWGIIDVVAEWMS